MEEVIKKDEEKKEGDDKVAPVYKPMGKEH